MAKRFTDTSIWDRNWFRKLSPRMKEAWRYLYEKCDHAGIWEIDTDTMSYFVGETITLAELVDHFGDKLQVVGDKIFVVGFIDFQYGELSEASKPHQSVIKRLKNLRLWKGYTKGIHTLKDKDKDKEQDKRGIGGKTENPFAPHQKALDLVYQKFPRKVGKSRGMKIARRDILSQEDYFALSKAVDNYAAECARLGTESKFIKHFSTFMGEWRDWVDFVPTVEPMRKAGSTGGYDDGF